MESYFFSILQTDTSTERKCLIEPGSAHPNLELQVNEVCSKQPKVQLAIAMLVGVSKNYFEKETTIK